jgi:hypothetical protein
MDLLAYSNYLTYQPIDLFGDAYFFDPIHQSINLNAFPAARAHRTRSDGKNERENSVVDAVVRELSVYTPCTYPHPL